MSVSSHHVRWDVVLSLHSRLEKAPPESEQFLVTDHAVTLALARRNDLLDGPYAMRNLWRNARFSLWRSIDRESDLHERAAQDLRVRSSRVPGWTGGDSVAVDTPESLYVAAELEGEIRAAVEAHDLSLVCPLNAMLAELTVGESAAACGVSSRSIDRARQTIRSIARAVIARGEA